MNVYTLPIFMFVLSLIGILINSTNIILLLVCIEIMLLSVCLNFLIVSLISKSILGVINSLLIVTVAAAESAIGLSIMISFYNVNGSVSISFLNVLSG